MAARPLNICGAFPYYKIKVQRTETVDNPQGKNNISVRCTLEGALPLSTNIGRLCRYHSLNIIIITSAKYRLRLGMILNQDVAPTSAPKRETILEHLPNLLIKTCNSLLQAC